MANRQRFLESFESQLVKSEGITGKHTLSATVFLILRRLFGGFLCETGHRRSSITVESVQEILKARVQN